MSTRFAEAWKGHLDAHRQQLDAVSPLQVAGRLTRINGLVMEAAGLKLPLGSSCLVMPPGGQDPKKP